MGCGQGVAIAGCGIMYKSTLFAAASAALLGKTVEDSQAGWSKRHPNPSLTRSPALLDAPFTALGTTTPSHYAVVSSAAVSGLFTLFSNLKQPGCVCAQDLLILKINLFTTIKGPYLNHQR